MLRATGTWAQFNQTEPAANGQRARASAGTGLGVRVSAYGFQRTCISEISRVCRRQRASIIE
jgi:hypothetical protein